MFQLFLIASLKSCVPLKPITIGTFVDRCVLNISTASFATGSVVVVVVKVVVVTVGDTSSQSKESHGHPAGQPF